MNRRWKIEDSLTELHLLASTAGLTVSSRFINKRHKPSAAYFIGSGKVKEIKEYCRLNDVSYVLFDDNLAPAQEKNLAKEFGDDICVMDRTELILTIFSQRAKSKEGKLQIELARLEYMLPRLTRQWTHLIHQEGGSGGMMGVKGKGEKQLEMDRRQIRQRIDVIKKELRNVEKYRIVQRKKRQRNLMPVIAIIGYTNAGKSTLLNSLTQAGALAENKLFATLDPTTRRYILPNNQPVLFIDTVGFIKKLPHNLVEAFNATLEEVRQADILLHVLDASDEKIEERKQVVESVLKELGAHKKTLIIAINKIDLMETPQMIPALKRTLSPCVPICARTGEGFDQLFAMIAEQTASLRIRAKVLIPFDKQHLVATLYEHGTVYTRKDLPEGIFLDAEVDRTRAHLFLEFSVNGFE